MKSTLTNEMKKSRELIIDSLIALKMIVYKLKIERDRVNKQLNQNKENKE